MRRMLQAASVVPHGASWQGQGLSMLVCAPPAIVRLERARHGDADPTLPAPGCCTFDDAGVLLPVGPAVYLRVGARHDSVTPDPRFETAVDVSSAWTHLAIAGPRAAELLSKGCAVDLHPRAFPAGACCATGFARMRVVLWRTGTEARYEMLVARSYALGLWHWLIDAATPYGAPPTKEGSP